MFTGAIPQDLDFLEPQRNAMVGLSALSIAILGAQPVVDGLNVLPTSPPSLAVSVAAGQIYSMAALDSLAYGSMPADAGHQILKQGILMDAQTLPINPPGTAGYSQWFLIQCAFQEAETGAVVLPYYNSANPTQAWAGPGNSGTQQFTRRNGVVTLQVKAGVPAPTGSHTQPQPDPGWTGLAWVTVSAGATTIQGANINAYTASNRLPIKLPQLIKAVGASYTLVTSGPRQLRAEEAGLVVVDTTNFPPGTEIRLPPAGAVPGVPLRFKIVGRAITPSVRRDFPWAKIVAGTPSDVFDLEHIYLAAQDTVELVSDGLSRWYWVSGFANHHFAAFLAAQVSVPHDVFTAIPWPDMGALYPPSWRVAGFPSRIRIPTTGRYRVMAGVEFMPVGTVSTAMTFRVVRLHVNGVWDARYAAYSNQTVPQGVGHVVSTLSGAFGFYAGDYLELACQQTNGQACALGAPATFINVRAENG